MTTTQIKFYIKYCKFFNQFVFLRRLGNVFHSKKLLEVSKYLKENYDLIPNEVLTASIITFIILFIPLLIFFSQIHIILAFIIPFLTAFLGANKIFNYPIANYNRIQYTLLQYSDLAFQDLLLILNTTNSIFDAIYFISEAGYPILSENFKDMIFEINFYGKSPEYLIYEFLDKLPNGNLKERLLNIMATKFHPNKILEQLELLAGEKKIEYESVTRQLESKLIIIVGICLFFPILTALFISFLGYLANILSFFMIPIFILFSHRIKTRILKANFELFGETAILEKTELDINNSNLTEFLQFLTYFGNELKRGVPQEVALYEAFRSFNGFLKDSIEKGVREIYYCNNSFKKGWNELKNTLNDSQIHFLIDLIDKMLDKSSIETGNRITSILQQLKANRELIQERESIIKAQQFKIKFLAFVMAAILGLVAGLAPLLFQISDIFHGFESGKQFLFWESLPLSLSLFIMVLYSSYFLPKLVKIYRPWRFSFWTGLVFCFFWYLTNYFI